MSDTKSRFDRAFIEKQRRQLTELREQILAARQSRVNEQAAINAETSGRAREFEDDAQRLTSLELQDNLNAVDDERLGNIERALQKIDEGTYGLSVGSGAPIAIERLEATPEALYTFEEQASRDPARGTTP
jgi:DnaK suppressor protein